MQPLQSVPNICLRGPAGVAEILVIDAEEVLGLAFDELERVIQIDVLSGATFKRIEFAQGGAQFKEVHREVRGATQVTQSVTFEHQSITPTVVRTIRRMASHCAMHALVKLNTGTWFYMGVSFFADRGFVWESDTLKLRQGTVDSQKVGGSAGKTHVLEGVGKQYAPEVVADVSLLPISEGTPPDPQADVTPPAHILLVPADDAVGVNTNPAIQIIFTEPVRPTGSGVLEVRRYSDDALIHSVTVATMLFDRSAHSARVPLGLPLVTNEHYYITVPAGAIEDLAGNAWPGLPVKGDWDFYTQTVPLMPPNANGYTPLDNATGVLAGSTLSVSFDANVEAGSGSIYLYNWADDTLVASYDVNGPLVTFPLATLMVVDASADLVAGGDYYVLIPAGVVDGEGGFTYWVGVGAKGDWNFTMETSTAPQVIDYTPDNAATAVSIDTAVTLEFDQAVQLGTGIMQLVEYVDGTGPQPGGNDIVAKSWDAATGVDLILTSGDTLLIFRSAFLNPSIINYGGEYYMVIPTGAIENASGQSLDDHHSYPPGTAQWSWEMAIRPTLSFNPINGSVNAPVTTVPSITVTSTSGVTIASGLIRVYDYDTGFLLHAIRVNNTEGPWPPVVLNSDTLYMDFVPVERGRHVYILYEGQILTDVANSEAALDTLSDKNDWHFYWLNDTDTPLVSSFTPPHQTTGVDVGLEMRFAITWDKAVRPVEYGFDTIGKYLRIYDHATLDLLVEVNLGNPAHVAPKNPKYNSHHTEWEVVIPNGAFMEAAKRYLVEVDQGAFQDPVGNVAQGIQLHNWHYDTNGYVPSAYAAVPGATLQNTLCGLEITDTTTGVPAGAIVDVEYTIKDGATVLATVNRGPNPVPALWKDFYFYEGVLLTIDILVYLDDATTVPSLAYTTTTPPFRTFTWGTLTNFGFDAANSAIEKVSADGLDSFAIGAFLARRDFWLQFEWQASGGTVYLGVSLEATLAGEADMEYAIKVLTSGAVDVVRDGVVVVTGVESVVATDVLKMERIGSVMTLYKNGGSFYSMTSVSLGNMYAIAAADKQGDRISDVFVSWGDCVVLPGAIQALLAIAEDNCGLVISNQSTGINSIEIQDIEYVITNTETQLVLATLNTGAGGPDVTWEDYYFNAGNPIKIDMTLTHINGQQYIIDVPVQTTPPKRQMQFESPVDPAYTISVNTVTKVGVNNWNPDVNSATQGSGDIWIDYEVDALVGSTVVGFSPDDSSNIVTDIDYAVYRSGNNISFMQNFVIGASLGTVALTDVVKLERVGSTITCYVNGVSRGTLTGVNTADMWMDLVIYHSTYKVANMHQSWGDCP